MRVVLPRGISKSLREYDRADFLSRVWEYRAGEHVTLLGPTEAGKTTLSYELMSVTATPELPALTLVMKPRDDTVRSWNRQLGFRKVTTWPPTPSIFHPRKPPGYALWPRHTFDPDVDDERMAHLFRNAMLHCYRKGKWIVFADELAGLQDELGLTRVINTLYSRGRSMRCGIWGASQRPFRVTLMAYVNSHHLFLANDPDKRSRERFGEIGSGINPQLIDRAVAELPQYYWLYVRRRDRRICVVRA